MDPVDYIRKILLVQGKMSLTSLLGYVKLCPSVAAVIGSGPEALRQLILNKNDEFEIEIEPSFTVENDLAASSSRMGETVRLINHRPKGIVVCSLGERLSSEQECKENESTSALEKNSLCDNRSHVPCLDNEFLSLSHCNTFNLHCPSPGSNLNDAISAMPNISSHENLRNEIEDWSYSRYEEIYGEAFPDPVSGFNVSQHKPNILLKHSNKSSATDLPLGSNLITNAEAMVYKINNKSCFARLENQEDVYIPLEAVAEAQQPFVKMADIVSFGLVVTVKAHVTENQRCRWRATKVWLGSSSHLLNEQRNEVGGVRTFIFKILEKFGRCLSVEKLFSLYQDTYSNYRGLFGDCEELLHGITNDNRFLVVQAEQKVYIRKDVENLALSFLLNTISTIGELSCEMLEVVDKQASPSIREILGKDLVTGKYTWNKLEVFCLSQKELIFVSGKIYRADPRPTCEFYNSCDKTFGDDYEVVYERYPGLRFDIPGMQVSSFATAASTSPVNDSENIGITLDDLDTGDRQNESSLSFTGTLFDSSLPKAVKNISRLKDSDEESSSRTIIHSALDFIRSNGPVKLNVLWEYLVARFKPELVGSLVCFRNLIEKDEHLLLLNDKVHVKQNVEEKALQFVISKLETLGPLELGSLVYHLSSAATEVQHLLQQKDGLNESNTVSADQIQIFLSRYADKFILDGDTVLLANSDALCTGDDLLDDSTSFQQMFRAELDSQECLQNINETSEKATVSFKSQDANDDKIKSRLKLVKLESAVNCEQCTEKKIEHFGGSLNISLAPEKETLSNVADLKEDDNINTTSVKTVACLADQKNVPVYSTTRECRVIQDDVPQLFIPCASSESLAASENALLSVHKNLFLASTLGSLKDFSKMTSCGLGNRDSSLINCSTVVSRDGLTAQHNMLDAIPVDELSDELKGFIISYNSNECVLILENGSFLSFTNFYADGSIFSCCEPAVKKGSIITMKKQIHNALSSGCYANVTVESCCCTLSEFCWLGSVLAVSHEAVYLRSLTGQLCEIPAAKWHSMHQCINPGRHLVVGDVVAIKSDPGTKTVVIFAIFSGKNASYLDTKVEPVECCNKNDIFFGRGIIRVLSSDFVSIQMANGEMASCLGNFLCQVHLEDTVLFSASKSADFISMWKARDIRKELEHLLVFISPKDDAKNEQHLNEMPSQSASTCAHSDLLTCDVASQTNSTGNIMTTRWYSEGGLGERIHNQ